MMLRLLFCLVCVSSWGALFSTADPLPSFGHSHSSFNVHWLPDSQYPHPLHHLLKRSTKSEVACAYIERQYQVNCKDLELQQSYEDVHNNVTHFYFRQLSNGVPIINCM
jgi:hypothetical protein